jgi:hypothetical protein
LLASGNSLTLGYVMRSSLQPALTLLFVSSLGLILYMLAGPERVPTSRKISGVEGRVLDADGPVVGARVRFKGMSGTVQTDDQGRFRLADRPAGGRVTAWEEGHFIGGAPLESPLTIRLSRLPAEDNADYEWVDADPNPAEVHNCGNCHTEIYREWSHSGHGRSATGRHFRNLYEGTDWNGTAGVGWGLLTQYPDGGGVCASCHAPTAKEYDLRRVNGVSARGVHCDYCHKIAEVADGPIGLSHGRFNLRLLRPSEGQLFFGALDDVDRGEDAFSPLYRDSRYCASCHEGVVFGVHVYSTFSEWQASPAAREGKQCQDCHMKPTGRMSNMAPDHGGIRRDPRTLANHRFFDGSQEEMLRRAVRVSATGERGPDGVKAQVRLWADGVGHRLPTGFVDRHLLLVVEGSDAEGKPIPVRSGPRLPALVGPELEGRPGRLYARVLRDFDGHSPTPFWLAAPDPPPDTRLVPGKIDETTFAFPATVTRLRLRVLYRRFWPEVGRVKKWPDQDLLVLNREFALTP